MPPGHSGSLPGHRDTLLGAGVSIHGQSAARKGRDIVSGMRDGVGISPQRSGARRVSLAAEGIAVESAPLVLPADPPESALLALESALSDAQRAERDIRDFLADAAHQLRSPMTCIRTCVETLLGDVTPIEREHLLAGLVREVARADDLIAGLLTLAGLDQGGRRVVRKPTDVVAMCEAELDRARALTPGLSITLRQLQPLDRRFELDEHAVGEILTNLLDNARRHARTKVELAVGVRGTTLELRVSDDGPGLTPEVAARAFDRFVSLDGHGGSGLGLAIAIALARAHAGDLVYDAGSFVLSLREAPVPDSGSLQAEFSPPSGWRTTVGRDIAALDGGA